MILIEELQPTEVLQQELVSAGWGWIMACGFRQLAWCAHARCGAMLNDHAPRIMHGTPCGPSEE